MTIALVIVVVLVAIAVALIRRGDNGLRSKIGALDNEKLVRLRETVYHNPRGLKGYHIRMVTDECARRGL